MKTIINIDQWNRKDHYLFFSTFEEPFFGVTVEIDCTLAYSISKEANRSFFLHYLYRALKAANLTEAFRYRILGNEVVIFDAVHASPTILRPNRTFGFAYMDYKDEEEAFYLHASEIVKEVHRSKGLVPAVAGENVIYFSAIPWLNFSSISHARNYKFPDSCPKISFGKMSETNGKRTMPVSVHVHHGLMDAYDVSLFTGRFQCLMDEKNPDI